MRCLRSVDLGPVQSRGASPKLVDQADDERYRLHSVRDGYFLEASWDNYFYTRQWNTPPQLQIIVMPSTSEQPGGAGELGVAPSMAAVACAYGRATGTMPTSFPINHGTLSFVPKPTVPPIPPSPTDGVSNSF